MSKSVEYPMFYNFGKVFNDKKLQMIIGNSSENAIDGFKEAMKTEKTELKMKFLLSRRLIS